MPLGNPGLSGAQLNTPADIGTPVERQGEKFDIHRLRHVIPPGRRVLYLLSGDRRPFDAQVLGAALGIEVWAVDIEHHTTHDISDVHVWEDLVAPSEGAFGAPLEHFYTNM